MISTRVGLAMHSARNLAPGREMVGLKMRTQCLAACPAFDEHKGVWIAGTGRKIVTDTTLFGPRCRYAGFRPFDVTVPFIGFDLNGRNYEDHGHFSRFYELFSK
jgi:hypothetical protein